MKNIDIVLKKERKKERIGPIMAEKVEAFPVVSKIFCSASQVILVVRRRPHVVAGGGFVATDCSQKVVFRVDGCGILGKKDEMILRDANGIALLLVRRKAGIVQALSIHKKWRGYASDYEGSEKLVFSLRETKTNYSCLSGNSPIRISIEEPAAQAARSRTCDFEIQGNFSDRECSITDSNGNTIAQVGVREEVEEMMASKDLYHVVVKPGIDQAFVLGVIAILDYMDGGSTRC